MVAVRIVQVAIDQIADVVTMRHGLMAATRTVDMTRLVTTATVLGRATGGVGLRDGNHVFVDVVAVRMVQVTIMQIVDMAFVADGGVAAARTMLVVVVVVVGQVALAHQSSPVC